MATKIDHIVVGLFQENTYFLIAENKSAIIIDPGGSGAEIMEYVRKNGLNIKMVINTHGHPDHVEANEFLKKHLGMPILIHKKDAEMFGVAFDRSISDGDVIEFEGDSLKIMETPGHTMGSICIRGTNFLLTGDTIFAGAIGRTDIGGNMKAMQDTLAHRFDDIPDDTILYPGHGPSTTMGRERKENPYLAWG